MSWASRPPSKVFCQPQEGGEAAQWLEVAVDTTTPGEEGVDTTTHAAAEEDSVEEEVSYAWLLVYTSEKQVTRKLIVFV